MFVAGLMKTIALALLSLALVALACTFFGREASVDIEASFVENATTAPTVLECDLGVVRPGERFTHEFTIQNGTSFTWHVQEIVKTCTCTVEQAIRTFSVQNRSMRVARSSRYKRREKRAENTV